MNNEAGQVPRPAVIKRRKNGGTRSEIGAEFVSRMVIIVSTARRPGTDLSGAIAPPPLLLVFELDLPPLGGS